MKFFISLLLLGFASISTATDMIRSYPAVKISESTYVITGPRGYPSVENQGFMNNPAFIITNHGVVVIDPGSSLQAGRMVMKQIRKATDKPVTHVFSTHVHGDHWLGNHAIFELFPKAQFIGHPQMIKKAHESEAENWLDFMLRATNGFTKGTKAIIPTQEVVDKHTLNIDGKTFRIYAPGEAHSGNDIMIEYVDDSVLFTGDNVLYTRIARMDDGTFKGNINACNVAININTKHYVPGHGPVGGIEIAKSYKSYLQIIYKEVTKYYDEGLEAYEMKPMVVQKLKAFSDWVNFEDEVGKHISLALLEIEQQDF